MTVIANAGLVLKDSQGNEGIVKTLTDKDIIKIANAITDVGQVVDPATHMPIEATKTSAGIVQLATAQDITNGTAGKVVDAQELNNFAQTLPSVNGVTDVSSGDNSNQIVVSKFGGSKTLTIDNVEHAGNAAEATHATKADTAASANSVAWDKVSGKPSSFTPSSHTHDDRYYTEGEIDTKLSGKSDTGHTHNYAGSSSAGGAASTALKLETYKQGSTTETYGAQYPIFAQWNDNTNVALKCTGYTVCVDKATTASSVAWSNVSSRPTKVSQFTNDSGYITSSGTAATISQKVNASAKTHTNYNTNGTYVPTMNFLSYWNGAYNSSGNSNLTYCAQGTIIGSSNIGSQSVNYANSAGSVAWGNVSGKPSSYTPSAHNHDSSYLKLSGGTITGTISKNNDSTSWVQGRNAAAFKTIAASSPGDSQYVPCWSAKSYQGSWDCGPYTSNVLHLSYITDANFNSNNNAQTADFTFATDGTFNAATLREGGTKLADKYQAKGSYVSSSTIWIG